MYAIGIAFSVPEQLVLRGGKVSNRFMYRKIYLLCAFYKLFAPPPQFFPLPWGHRAIIHTQPFVGYHKVFIDSQHLAEAFTGGAGAIGVVKRKQVGGGLFKLDAIQFKLITEVHQFLTVNFKVHFAFSFIKRSAHGVGYPVQVIFLK
ncbi:MAG: hypothetical protein BWY72_02468 [Bacteroidetes bacterium ADurb.Bin416]|nr:MAG: hypothetical protein BWY72_02468 [Bacteroidetes bacterium ADurb.Bin416]